MHRINLAFLVAAILAAAPASALDYAPLVINEVDYDQPGYDDGGEFIELKNTTERDISLEGWTIELYDGANLPGEVYMTLGFQTAPIPVVPAGGYFVMCRAEAYSTLTTAQCDKYAPSNLVIIRNGVRDGIVLKNGETVVDSLSWGQVIGCCTEGETAAPKDFDTKDNYSLSRVPDGLDTGDNGFDFKWTCASPKRANYTAEECLCINTTCSAGKVCNPNTGVCEVQVPEVVVEDTVEPDTSTGDDVTEPGDTAVPDAAQPDSGRDTSAADAGNDAVISRDNGGHADTASDTASAFDVIAWQDLPTFGDESGKSNGCSAGREPSGAAPLMLILVLACVPFIAFRAARKFRRG